MATVSDLLKSCSGVYHQAAAETNKMEEMRPQRGSHPPGIFYYYNNWDFNVLGTIFEKVTGARIFEAFKKEIAEPIAMENFSLDDCRYSYEEKKSMHPAYNFRMTARDLARFGLL
jgi:CubicO group peptidase (beta-lactamase class C family)